MSNVAPSVEAGPDQTVDEDTLVTFSGSFSDPGVVDTHTIEWDFGDGSTTSDTLTPSHTYSQPGDYTVLLTVTDNGGGVGTDSLLITVEEVVSENVIVLQHRRRDMWLALDLDSGDYLWRMPDGTRYENQAVVSKPFWYILFRSVSTDPNNLRGIVSVLGRIGIARLRISGVPFWRWPLIIDTNIDNNDPCH